MAKFNRLEAKYLIDRATRTALTLAIRPHVQFDPQATGADGTYVLQNLYFDSPTRWAYREKLDGVPVRTKLRLRIYNPAPSHPGPVYVEIKHKEGDFIFKRRTGISRAEYEESMQDFLFMPRRLDDPVLHEYARMVRVRGLRPAVLVRYRRQAFCGRRDPTIRVTFDDRVEALRTDDLFCVEHSPFTVLPPEHAVLEIKVSGRLPRWLHRVILAHDLDRRAISKFHLCLRSSAKSSHRIAREMEPARELD